MSLHHLVSVIKGKVICSDIDMIRIGAVSDHNIDDQINAFFAQVIIFWSLYTGYIRASGPKWGGRWSR